jgi:hypothetical protein
MRHVKLGQIYDLKRYPDKTILEVCFRLGFYDERTLRKLDELRRIRNSSAHVNEEKIQTRKYLSYLNSVVEHIELIGTYNDKFGVCPLFTFLFKG